MTDMAQNQNPTPNHSAGRYNYSTGTPIPGWPKVKDLISAPHKRAAAEARTLDTSKPVNGAQKERRSGAKKPMVLGAKTKAILDRLMVLDFFKRRPDTAEIAGNIAMLYDGTPFEAIGKAITAISGDPDQRALAMALNKANQKPA